MFEAGAEYGVGALAIGIEPQAVELRAKPLSDQIQAGRKWSRRCAVGDDDNLGGLRAALDHHLQVACETQMGRVRVAGHLSIDKSAPHDGRNMVDQGVLDTAVRDMNHSMGTELK
jgi:hypothetical protein